MRFFLVTFVLSLTAAQVNSTQAYSLGKSDESQNNENDLDPLLRAKKKTAEQVLTGLNQDLTIWIDQHFTSGVALKKKDKYLRKVGKFQSRFQSLYVKCGFHTKKSKKSKVSKRSIVRRDVEGSLQDLATIFKGKIHILL